MATPQPTKQPLDSGRYYDERFKNVETGVGKIEGSVNALNLTVSEVAKQIAILFDRSNNHVAICPYRERIATVEKGMEEMRCDVDEVRDLVRVVQNETVDNKIGIVKLGIASTISAGLVAIIDAIRT